MNRTLRITAAALTAALVAVPALPAVAKDGDVIRRGNCSGSTDWKLKASPEDGRIEVEGEIDSNKNGQSWNWKLKHNGALSAKGSATTKAPSGSFSVRRVMVDISGTDTFVFVATNPANGETCRGTVQF